MRGENNKMKPIIKTTLALVTAVTALTQTAFAQPPNPGMEADVLPTLDALLVLGLESTLPGRSLLGAGSSESPAYFVVATDSLSSIQRMAVVSGSYKLVRSGETGAPRERLYRLPDETRDLAGAEPDVVRTLRSELNRLLSQLRFGRPPVRRTLPTDQRARLEALRYVAD
jgi:hypothetical protein